MGVKRDQTMRRIVLRQLELLFDLEDYLTETADTRIISMKLSEAYDKVEEAFEALRLARDKENADEIRE